MRCHQSPAEARQDAQRPEAVHQAAQAAAEALARARYLRLAGGGLVAAFLGSITKPAEVRARDGKLIFGAAVDGVRSADEAPTSIRVEYLGHRFRQRTTFVGPDAEALAARLTKGTQIYAEGSLRLCTWTGRDGVERSGLQVTTTHLVTTKPIGKIS